MVRTSKSDLRRKGNSDILRQQITLSVIVKTKMLSCIVTVDCPVPQIANALNSSPKVTRKRYLKTSLSLERKTTRDHQKVKLKTQRNKNDLLVILILFDRNFWTSARTHYAKIKILLVRKIPLPLHFLRCCFIGRTKCRFRPRTEWNASSWRKHWPLFRFSHKRSDKRQWIRNKENLDQQTKARYLLSECERSTALVAAATRRNWRGNKLSSTSQEQNTTQTVNPTTVVRRKSRQHYT